MLYTGIDYHKKYSVVSTMDAAGTRIREVCIDQNEPAAFAAYFQSLPEPSCVVVEACWNWGWLYDELGEIDGVADVVLAHPFKTRLIADAQIKTDRLDARALATLLRGNLVATVHAPTPANRARKHVIRQRLFLVRVRTMIRNRVHTVIARQRKLDRPVFSDQFGKKGLHWLKTLALPAPDDALLKQDLATLEQLGTVIKALETDIAAANADDPAAVRLQTLPGVGPILAAVMAAEIDGIARFPRADKPLLLRRPGAHHAQLRRQDRARPHAAPRQPLAEMGVRRGRVGGGRLLALLRRHLSPAPRPRQESQHRHHDHRAPHVRHRLAPPARRA